MGFPFFSQESLIGLWSPHCSIHSALTKRASTRDYSSIVHSQKYSKQESSQGNYTQLRHVRARGLSTPQSYFLVRILLFPAAITKHHRRGKVGLNNRYLLSRSFWRPEVQDQSVSRVDFFLSPLFLAYKQHMVFPLCSRMSLSKFPLL